MISTRPGRQHRSTARLLVHLPDESRSAGLPAREPAGEDLARHSSRQPAAPTAWHTIEFLAHDRVIALAQGIVPHHRTAGLIRSQRPRLGPYCYQNGWVRPDPVPENRSARDAGAADV